MTGSVPADKRVPGSAGRAFTFPFARLILLTTSAMMIFSSMASLSFLYLGFLLISR